MLIGAKDRFAVEAEVTAKYGSIGHGHFRFWIHGRPVGDWSDSAHLTGICSWLRSIVEESAARLDAGYTGLSANEIFARAFEPVFDGSSIVSLEVSGDLYRRFHISHVGMSAFQFIDMLLIHLPDGSERCIWRDVSGDARVHEAVFPIGVIEDVALRASAEIAQAIDGF